MMCSELAPRVLAATALCSIVLGCGGGHASSPPTVNNIQAIVVGGGPNDNYANGLFTNITICVPGTSNCQNITNVLVDTESFGVRVLSSALGTLSSSLPQQKGANGSPVMECAQFADSVIWGPVKTADVKITGETAPSIPIQVIDASTVPIPSACKSIGPAEEDLAALGANGILGIGFFIQDCGNSCSLSTSSNPGFYYSCAGSSCSVAAQSGNQQVQNPITAFAQDNNGVVIELPSVSGPAPNLTGSLTFGIGTAGANALGSAQVFIPDSSGNITTAFNGKQYPGFLDTGSNAYFFLDSKTSGIADCSSTDNGFYCPSSPASLSATNSSAQGETSSTVNFTITSASQLFSTGDFVLPSLGGPNPGTFDWGLPFFIGRKVYVALEGHPTPAGSGPFWAY